VNLRRDLGLLADVLVAPRAACAAVRAHAPVGVALVVVSLVQGAAVGLQTRALEPALRADPMVAESPGGPDVALERYGGLRLAAALFTPAATAARCAALATLLQGACGLLGVACRWRLAFALALHAELVLALETACVAGLLAARPPAALDEIAALQLRAGLDLVWQPESARLRALVGAASAFTVWWGALLAVALARGVGLRPRAALALAGACWAALVAVRVATRPG
jgi:hypothetical protein